MKKLLIVIAVAAIAFFVYRYFQDKNSKGLASVNFNEVVIEKKLEVAKDSSSYFFSRRYETNKGIGMIGIKPWIKVETNYAFEVPFYVECKDLKFKNISDSTLTIVVSEIKADALQNQRTVGLKVQSGKFWNETGNQSNKYLVDFIPEMCKNIKRAQYASLGLESIQMDGWQRDIVNQIAKNPQGITREELLEKAKLGVSGIVSEFIKGLKLTKKSKVNIKVEVEKLNIFGNTVSL